MERLPTEILIKVFGLVHQDNNVELQRVCRRWNELIKKYTLFKTLIVSSQPVVDKFVKRIKEKAIIASNIQQIAVDSDYNSDLAVNELLSLLPSLRILVYSIVPDMRDDINVQYPWRESIQHLVVTMDITEFSLNVLSSGICPNLSSLCVTIRRDSQVIHLLHNAPALKDLILYSGRLDFTELDLIHDNAPHLKSLTLDSTIINNYGFKEHIDHPATSLACFITTLHIVPDAFRKRNLFLYICKKYPNLEQLKFHTPFVRHCTTPEDRAVQDAWKLLGAGLKKLEPCLQDIDDDLHSDTDDEPLFEVLDASAFQLEHLEIYTKYPRIIKRLSQSQQAYFIQTLVLDSLNYPTFEWLKQLVVLQKLSLSSSMSNSITKFNDILANAPSTLKSLTLENYYLAFDRHYKETCHIEALSFKSVRFPNRMDSFIDQYFPKLTTLELYYPDIKQKMWDLPSTSLLVLQLVFDYEGSSVLVKTSNNNESRVYSSRSNSYIVGHGYKFFELPFKSWPTHETNIMPGFTLHCHSLRTFLFKE